MTGWASWAASVRLRILFRGAFLLLLVTLFATVQFVLKEEKQLAYDDYRFSFQRTAAQIAARLRHPTGQLALLNPSAHTAEGAVVPVVLPYGAIDFDDEAKVQQAIEMSGCLAQYPDDASLCVAIGDNPWAGAFVYVAGYLDAGTLTPHSIGLDDLGAVHRLELKVAYRGDTTAYIAPLEPLSSPEPQPGLPWRARLAGFPGTDADHALRPTRDFRGWLWQLGRCVNASGSWPDCPRRTFITARIPIPALRDLMTAVPHGSWPPSDLSTMRVSVRLLAPGDAPPLFDSSVKASTAPFALSDLATLLQPGETLRIDAPARRGGQTVAEIHGVSDRPMHARSVLARWIAALPVAGFDAPLSATEDVTTPLGEYRAVLQGDVEGVNDNLTRVAGRILWFAGTMAVAIIVAWIVIELGIIRRITILKRRAEAVRATMKGVGDLERFELRDLKGGDELGILSGVLADLLGRVREDAQRERIRLEQEKDMWHAVGHEIMAPLQSLMALHDRSGDASRRYIQRMQQAIRVLYGSASPSEAFQLTRLALEALDLNAFLAHVAANARFVGIEGVRFDERPQPVWVRGDEYALEDVMTHVLRNADRYRKPGTPIDVTLHLDAGQVQCRIHNEGPSIPAELADRVFEYGVSGESDPSPQGGRGQGLFVAKTYMAKMGGTIVAVNEHGGVTIVLSLPVASELAVASATY